MDLNEIVDMQSDAAVESTLESEIDALSKIITDTKDEVQKLDDNDEDFKLDGDDLAFTASLQCDSMESDNCELLSNNTLDIKNILDNPEEIENFMSPSTNDNSLQDLLKETPKTDDQENDSSQEPNNGMQILEEKSANNDNNLSLISEVYNSQESQSSIEDELTLSSKISEEVENIQNEPINTMDTEFASTSAEDKQVLLSSSNKTCENDEDIENTLIEETNNQTNSEFVEEILLQEHENKNIDESEPIQDDCNEKEFSVQNYPLKDNENKDDSIITTLIKENTETESVIETEYLNDKTENSTQLSKTDDSLEKITEQKSENSDIFSIEKTNESLENVTEPKTENADVLSIEKADDSLEKVTEEKNENSDVSVVCENIDENTIALEVPENVENNIENYEITEDKVCENIGENTVFELPENIEQNIQDSEIIEENVSKNIDKHTAACEISENVEQNIENFKEVEDNANLKQQIEEVISKKDIVDDVTKPDNESMVITDVEINTVQEEISEENNKLISMDTDNSTAHAASIDTEDVEMNEINEVQNLETNIEDKKEETNIEDKKEETNIENKKGETNIEDKKEETNIEDKKEATNIEDKKEETNIEEKNEETNIEEENEETNIEDLQNINTDNQITDFKPEEENIECSPNVKIDDCIKTTQNDKDDMNSEDTKSIGVDVEMNEENEVLQSLESSSSDAVIKEEVTNVADFIEHLESSECLEKIDHSMTSSSNTQENLKNSDVDANNKALQETDVISDVSISQDTEIKELANSEILQITDTVVIDNNDTDDTESSNTKISITESTFITATSSKNEMKHEKSLEQQLAIESNETKEQDLNTLESKEENEIHSIKSSALEDDNSENSSTNINKDSTEAESLSNEIKKSIDKNLSEPNITLVEKESINEDFTPRVETPEDLNITLELEESEISEKCNTVVSEELQDENVSKFESESKVEQEINVNLQRLSEEKEEHLDSEEIEDQVDINLSLDPDDYGSPSQDLPDDQMILSDPLDPLDPLSDLVVDNVIDTENVDAIKIPETSEAIEKDLSELLDVNKTNDPFINNDQNLDSQDIATSIINEVEKELGSDFNEFLETEENIDDVVKDFTIAEPVDSPSSDIQAFNEKLEDPLSSFSELEALPSNLIPLIEESAENMESNNIEKEEDISLVFEESSQSPKDTEDNDKFLNDLSDPFCETSDTLENITECNQSESVNEQNKDNVEKEETDNFTTRSEISLGLESSEQLDEIVTCEISSKAIINNADKEEILNEVDEISELESAVKFLQESEEQDIQASNINEEETDSEGNSSIFVAVEDSLCDTVTEAVSDLPEVNMDPIAISEAEIISEAAKLESERKEKMELEQQLKNPNKDINEADNLDTADTSALSTVDNLLTNAESNEKTSSITTSTTEEDLKEVPEMTSDIIEETKSTSETLSQVALLDERYKEPPKIEIPEVAAPKIGDLPGTPRASLLIQKDAKLRLESPERAGSAEPRITDTPKKDMEKQYSECENVGSPRIILKIAKSAIADCSEPRSPKSPKIRSAANSPNPEDSPGHKLGKIKLKLSKSGHPSIIPNNDNFDDTVQWHTDSTSTLSPLGMKIKLTKSSDTSSTDYKHEEHEETKEKGHKSDESRKTETSIGMKIKLSKSGDASIVQQDNKETSQETVGVKKQDSPSIGMKIKLSKSGDASIIQQDSKSSSIEDSRENIGKSKEKLIDDTQDIPRRTDSPLGMKIKLSKSGDTATVISNEPLDIENEEPAKRTDSPIGVKIKLAKTKGGTASIISNEISEDVKEKVDVAESSKKIKSSKRREISEDTIEIGGSDIVSSDNIDETSKGSIGMKIKFSKAGDASVVSSIKEDETCKKSTEQPLGMKIKLSKTGDPSIIHSEVSKEAEDIIPASRMKHSKNKDYSAIQQKSKDDSHLEMKIKLSKTGHPTIINTSELQETTLKSFKKSHSDVTIEAIKHQTVENTMIDLHNKRKEITIAPIESKKAKMDPNLKQMLPDITIQPIITAAKKEQQLQQQQQKLLLESNNANISQQQMNVINQEISITQMLNRTINDECKLPQICSLATGDTLMGERLKSALNLPGEASGSSPFNSDCEIIEPIQPELIIVNENSNSSQDVMIIDEVPSVKSSVRAPKKRGRPRRNANIAVPMASTTPATMSTSACFPELDLQRDPLSLDQPPLSMQLPSMSLAAQPMQSTLQQHQSHLQPQVVSTVAGTEGSERPRRTCRSQKSYAPPKRGRGRGRGKRKNEAVDIPMKKQRIDQDLTAIENSTTAVIALEKLPIETSTGIATPSELFKALNQPTLDRLPSQRSDVEILEEPETIQPLPECDDIAMRVQEEVPEKILSEGQGNIEDDVVEIDQVTTTVPGTSIAAAISAAVDSNKDVLKVTDMIDDKTDELQGDQNKSEVIPILKVTDEEKQPNAVIEQSEAMETNKDSLITQEHQNWLAPSIKKVSGDSVTRSESISTLTVIDEETRMSAESGSRSQTPARNITIPGTIEPILNEESQGSVLSTATTESEKVKVKNRRMEISFDPDEGPFTVEKIAEYEWPLKEDRPAGRGETSMIQEQISQYLGVKSFKRKYPDLKRRMVDMEERNFLRENGLVSESMCDMGLTAVSSSEVLDIMCSDFPEQYEEYRKHMREKAAKEHSKKQKELSAAANAERNRIDLAEMAMQSAISWNAGLNKARHDLRKCSLDLQTFTVHMPKRPTKLDPSRRCNTYPVALIPGQYTEYYREYTPAELRYYPLNTVLYGPMRPNERKLDSQSEGSQSDSDSDSSSDDSSSSSSEGTQDTEGSQSTMDEVDMDLAVQSDVKCKMCLNNLNKNNRPEVLIQCGTCNGNVHPSCIDLTLDMVPHIRAYAWQCTDCKTCAQCHDPADEDKMLFCDMCDRGYHIYCVGLRRVPQGRWHCQECAVCANCGSKEPGGANSDRNSVAQWQHEYKKGDKNTRVYVSTFCVPCSKLWRKGRYCPHCSRCHNAPRLDLEPNLVHCAACDKYLHLGCVETKGVIIDKKHYLCDFCSPNRQQLVKPLISKTFKT